MDEGGEATTDERPTADGEGVSDGRAFWVALALVGTMFLGAAGIAAAALLGGDDHGAPMAVAPGGQIDLAEVPPEVAEHYRFADRHASVYEQVPCFCGCDAMLEHRHLLDCFVRPAGGWEAHASGCGVCLQESAIIRDMLADGASPSTIRDAIVAEFTIDA